MTSVNLPDGRIPVFKQDPILVVVLAYLTCGLYLIYWDIKLAEVINAVTKKDTISPAIAIFSGCCFPVHGYYFYLVGQSMGDLGRLIGKEQELKDKGTLLLILGIFFPPIAAMIVQGHINELYPTAA